MHLNLGDKIIASGKLRFPVLIALAIAFSALWLIFTFILSSWSTKERQQDLAELVEQVDDQLYQVGEDLRYQLLSSATLLASRNPIISAIQSNNEEALQDTIKVFHRNYSSQALIEQIQIYSVNGDLLANFGVGSTYYNQAPHHDTLYAETDSATGINLNLDGKLNIYAIVGIFYNNTKIGYVQVTKPLIDTVQDVSALNKANLYLFADKAKISKNAVSRHYNQLGIINHWDNFTNLVLMSPIQGNINLPMLADVLDDVMTTDAPDLKYMRDQVGFGDKIFNLALFPVNDIDGNYLGRVLLLKDISADTRSYQVSLTVTSISFGVIMSFIFISFWYFLGRIENNLSESEVKIIQAKIDAENARDEAEEAKKLAIQANQIKSDFLAKMSHELRTPLNAIIGITEMMSEDANETNDENYIEPLDRVLRSSKHLLALINDILDLSKIEAGKMELHPEVFDIGYFINDVKRSCEALALKQDNTLIVEIEPNIGDLFTDVTKLRQVLLNLISNACKFTENGTIRMTLNKLDIDSIAHIQFAICDNGIGMDKNQLSKLFNDFQQVDSSATRRYEGTGLGLSISQKLANLMGGNITVKSEIDIGTNFYVTIPVAMPLTVENTNNTLDNLEETESQDDSTQTDTNLLLIIDDDQHMIELLKYHLQSDSNELVPYAIQTDIAEFRSAKQPSVFIINSLINKQLAMNIIQTLSKDETLNNVPIVVICEELDKQTYLNLGVRHCLLKPINKSNIGLIFSEYLS
ncbi:hypothetical protein KO525_14520 [Psychrosphaera sp. B3R10]|uniref:ATP-binding protein n=1 Tax=unclassified Psychrosphaera TaxID=2641570 RepID=UPI001C09AA04|nr:MULTISPECIES: ATP-binding protein [unclassified Psychrosphaera]MBU2883306.1 hypothetical protein [Psychrosphaera sp. I2R16]MBU2990600.1 hypothetical protein [Psychrosphaera sp. B3R10]